jgi:LysM repeat protein
MPALRTDVMSRFTPTFAVVAGALAQSPQGSPSPGEMAALEKKIDQINTKIDALSQQILKLEQQVSRPGTIIGEATPSPVPTAAAASASETAHPPASNGNTHVVARGETLTSIAKQNKVGVEELQKFNHIEDGRKLQAGQTIMIPAPSTSPAASASPSPTAE